MCVMFGRMLAMFWMSSGEAGRGRNLETHLITGPHQMLQLFTHQAWNFVCGEMIYNFTLTAGGKHRERGREREGLKYKCIFFSASKFLNGFQTLIIFHSLTAITWREGEKSEAVKNTWHLVGLLGWGQWSLLISCLHESTKSLEGTDTLWRRSHWLATSRASAAAWRAAAICDASIWILRKVKTDGLLLLAVRRAWSKAPRGGTGTTENLVLSIRAISFGALWWRVLSIAAQSGSLLSFNDSEMWKEAEVLWALTLFGCSEQTFIVILKCVCFIRSNEISPL